jgi:hypothetical protein
MHMRSGKVLGILAVAACVALAGTARAQVVKGAGKSSTSIIKTPAPGPTTVTPKAAGSVSSKPVATVVGKPPTGGGSFAMKLAKDVGLPAKPGFADGNYVLEVEASATPTGDMVGSPLAAAYFITFTVTLGKCTIDNHPDFTTGSPNCDGPMQPVCAPAPGAGKCSATLYQVAGNLFQVAGGDANQPFGARFRIRPNVDPNNCDTGHLIVDGLGEQPNTSTCRDGAVVGVGGVALGTPN